MMKLRGSMPHNVSMKIWMSREDRVLIDRAAAALGVAPSAFIREASVREAQNVILDQTHIKVDEKTFRAIVAELDRPVRDNPPLRDLFQRRAPWEL